jgi:hypothetical protein
MNKDRRLSNVLFCGYVDRYLEMSCEKLDKKPRKHSICFLKASLIAFSDHFALHWRIKYSINAKLGVIYI